MDNGMDKCKACNTNTDSVNRARSLMVGEGEIVRLSEVFKILGDPTRLRIISVLSECEMCVCDIAVVLGMTQSAISHQLRLLRTAKLVKYKKEGKSVIYSLDDEHILQLFNQGMEHVRHV